MLNPTVRAIDEAIAQVDAELAALPTTASHATVRSEHVTLGVDADASLTSLTIESAAIRAGLGALGAEICRLQARGLEAIETGVGGDDVQLDGEAVAPSELPHASGAPQLPEYPSQADVDAFAAQLHAAIDQAMTRRQQAELPQVATSELVSVELDAAGRLVEIDFKQRAVGASGQELADDLLATVARARTGEQED